MTQIHLGAQTSGEIAREAVKSEASAYRIAGVIVNANSGAPLDRVDVTIAPAGVQGSEAAITTGEDGGFAFDGIKAGKYSVVASRRGYITSAYQGHEGFFTAIVTGPGLDTTHLRFSIMPAAILSGTVIDDEGDPVSGASVTLFRQNSADNQDRAIRMRTDVTDDTGTFEFTRLQPGTYFVSGSATPWYAFHPQRIPRFVNGAPIEQEPPHSPLDVAYPMAFYADATDSSAATPISLRAGDHPQISLTMHALPAVQLRIQLPQVKADSSGMPPRDLSFPMLSQTVFGTTENVRMSSSSMNESDGRRTLEIAGLAPGEYALEFSGQNGQMEGSSTPVDLSSDRVLDRSSATAGTDVDGTLTMAFGVKAPADLSVSLAPANGSMRSRGQKVSENGAFSFHDVEPGFYELMVTGGGRQLPVLHLKTAGQVIEGGRLQIGSEAVTLVADAAIGSATMNGFVQRNGKRLGGAMVVLAPHNPKSNPYLFRRDQSNSDGSFTLGGIVPGQYTLIAIDDAWELEWAREGALQKYLVRGKQVEIRNGADKIDLSDPIEAQAP